MQHMKAEHQQEIDKLQRTVADLQRQLQQHQAPPTHHSANQCAAQRLAGTSALSYKPPMRYR